MGDQPKEKIPLEKLATSVVYNHLISKKAVDDIYKDVLARIQATPSYKRIKDVAVLHMTEIMNHPSRSLPCAEERDEKKKQIAEIGVRALEIDSALSEVINGNVRERARSIVYNALKDLSSSGLQQQKAETGAISPKKIVTATENHSSFFVPEFYKEICNKSIGAIHEDNSCSVSSVHASDLSSFDDEVELSDKEDGNNAQKKALMKFDNERVQSSNISNTYPEKEENQLTRVVSSKLLHSKKSKSVAPDDDSRRTLPKRIRKPNSKYASKDMIHARREFLDVQRDLKIINGPKVKPNKVESPKSPVNRKRKAE